ncbi:MAG: PilZ domain-containing protein [Desulfobacteraceae bacterium]|nr:PilZ domain-containing protein [Desulfobacteraceae bacterium]MBC2757549.1 PilZ domain-containing protein [Desulfobacteraceae bacterium]
MNNVNNRKFTRKKVWQDTEATIKVDDPFSAGSRKTLTIKGIVDNLSTGGMFLITEESVPVSSKAEITINFDPASSSSDLSVKAYGKTVHSAENGVGIEFTSINMAELQQCIIKKMNQRS